MALEGVISEKSEENNGNVPDGKANGIDNKSKQVRILLDFHTFCEFSLSLWFSLIGMKWKFKHSLSNNT